MALKVIRPKINLFVAMFRIKFFAIFRTKFRRFVGFKLAQNFSMDSKYFELYGAPNDGVFDVEKMATVVEILLESNEITMDQFIQNK